MLNNWDVLQTRFNPQEEPTRSLLQLLPFPCTTTFTRKAYDHYLCFPYRVSLLDRLHHAVMHTLEIIPHLYSFITHRSHSKVRSSLRSARCYTWHCRKLLACTTINENSIWRVKLPNYKENIQHAHIETQVYTHTDTEDALLYLAISHVWPIHTLKVFNNISLFRWTT